MKKILYVLVAAACILTACDKWLDKLPDNRTEIDTEEEILNLLTAAYPRVCYNLLTELLADNGDDMGDSNPYSDRFMEQVVYWQDITEEDDESPENVWNAHYHCIAAANEALDAIGKIDGVLSQNLSEAKGEALVARAYNHFMLASIFCREYSQNTESALGIPYMTEPEVTLNPKYDRGTLGQTYAAIEKDLEEGLPLIGDNHYKVPKYHFNTKAAYAFATRFFLHYGKYDKAIECANKVLGTEPKSVVRNWEYYSTISHTRQVLSTEYVDESQNCDLLLTAGKSRAAIVYGGGFYSYSRFAPNANAMTRSVNGVNIWGDNTDLWLATCNWSAANLDRRLYPKHPYVFATNGGVEENMTTFVILTGDEVLLNRAEAYILSGNYDAAAADLTTWMHAFTKNTSTLTPASIDSWYGSRNYNSASTASVKDRIKPGFVNVEEGSQLEHMLQCVLSFKRCASIHEGLRWFDIKRYGIEVPRRIMTASGYYSGRDADVLASDDLRKVVQIPLKVRDAGMQANPR